nr:hypothetical protein CFP56_30608 [Quercus suber]
MHLVHAGAALVHCLLHCVAAWAAPVWQQVHQLQNCSRCITCCNSAAAAGAALVHWLLHCVAAWAAPVWQQVHQLQNCSRCITCCSASPAAVHHLLQCITCCSSAADALAASYQT